MLSQDPTAAGEELERFAHTLQQKAHRYTRLQEELGSAGVTESSAGGEVTVTVDANGVLTRLDLSERTRGEDPARLSATIMACLRKAQARLREQVATLVRETVGDDPAGNNIVRQYTERFPDPVDEEEEPSRTERERSLGRLADDSSDDRREPRAPRPRPRQQDDDEDLGGGSILR